MTRTLAAAATTLLLIAAPATAATRTADAARFAGANLSPMTQPVRIALRPTTLRPAPLGRTRYDLSRMMARNFGAIGQHQLDVLVASVQ